ncbi:MAG: acyl-CoA dehydrogenase family protein [Myxococcales bacterium]|nr:acyl-CoA dehydrogenase family protein [Myxococcales bacterium]
MDLSFSAEHDAFRAEVRAFLKTNLPPHLRAKADVDAHFEMPEIMEWHRILYKKGWVAPHWPNEHGGPGWDAARRFILTEELELAGTPGLSPFGLIMVGPLIMQFGTDAQKARFLPKILSGEEVWCQGYSEPNAGSDLASLKLRADDDGKGNFVLNGQKTWTTYAQYADWIFVLARTDSSGPKHKGISFLLVPMKTKGLVVKPFLSIGNTLAFSETFFEDVLVPRENLVGPLHGGWSLAKALLGHERTFIASVGASTRLLARVKRIAAETRTPAGVLFDDPIVRAKIAAMEIKLEGLRMANYRAIAGAQLGHAPGPESSLLKIRGSEILQQLFELAMSIMGHDSLSWFNGASSVPPIEEWVPSQWAYYRASTIYGGSNEIQRNVIAKMILNLPGA